MYRRVLGVNTEHIPDVGLQRIKGRAVLCGGNRGIGAGGNDLLKHILQGAGRAVLRSEDKILRLGRQGLLQRLGLSLSGSEGNLQKLGRTIVDDALPVVRGEAVPDGNSEIGGCLHRRP